MYDEPIETFMTRQAKSSTGQIGMSLGVAIRHEVQKQSLLPTPTARDFKDGQAQRIRDGKVQTDSIAKTVHHSEEVTEFSWGRFEPAIRRWEQIIGRSAPAPTKPDGKDGAHRLNSKLTEWMMGLPDGWITDAGLTRAEELKAAGNGVVPQQAELALRILLEGIEL